MNVRSRYAIAVEPLMVNSSSRFGLMLAAADTMPPDEFERVWLSGAGDMAGT